MRAEIKRYYGQKETLGHLTVFDENNQVAFECKTLELPWKDNQRMISCIPEGDYLVKKRMAFESRPYDHFILLNVSRRDSILIHTGNRYDQILGCILVGDKFADINADGVLDVLNSGLTLRSFVALMPDKWKLKIYH
jgi:hypothetical protein